MCQASRNELKHMTPIRIMIVDDQDIVRRGLALFFHAFKDFQLVAEAANGLQAVQRCDELQPDVILMDLMMPEMDGITATKLIRQKHPHIQIIALTSVQDNAAIKEMLDAGAISYLLKNAPVGELENAILAASEAARAESK